MVKKRFKPKQRYKHKSQKLNSEIKEKGFLIAFLVFAIIIMIVVFKNPTGNIISNVELDKITFDQNEYLKGDVSLEFQEGDLLPSKTNVVFLIYTNMPKCPQFVCQNNKTIDWYSWNATLEECVLTEPDPEGQCCSRYKDCSQLIANSGFEKVIGTTPYKWRKTRNVGGTVIEVETDYDVDEETISTIAVIDTEDISREGYAAFKQDLSAVIFSSDSNSETQNIITDEEKTLMFDMPSGCNRMDPYVAITPFMMEANPGGILTYTVTINNYDINCPDATTFDLWPGSPLPMLEHISSFTFDNPSLTIASGQSKSTTLRIILKEDVPIDYTDSIEIGVFSSNHYATYATANYKVIPAGGEIRRCQVLDSSGKPHDGIQQYKNDAWSVCKSYKLKAKIGYEVNIDEGCAFEIILVGTNNKKLHYYYQISDALGCERPFVGIPPISSETSDYYVPLQLSEDLYLTEDGYLNNFSRYIFDDWPTNWVIPVNFQLEEIWLKSYGTKIKEDGYEYNYGQVVRWDDIKIIVSEAKISDSCTDRNKKCCIANTGLGEYYELKCSEGYECWSSCAPKRTEKLSWFIGKSSSNKKKNMTTDEYSYIKPIGDQLPGELCDEGSDKCYLNYEYGSGYTACSDSSSDSPKKSCRNWDNVYTTEIYSARLKTPKQNGSYNFAFRLEYAPEDKYCGEYEDDDEEIHIYETCLIAEAQVPFTIGDKQIICAPKWEDCENITICNAGTNYEEHSVYQCTDSNECGIACNDSITIGLNVCKDWGKTGETCEPEKLPCTADDYDVYDWCDSWTPSPCSPDETQTRTCEYDSEICNATHPDTEAPVIERECTLVIITEYAEEQRASGKSKSNVKEELQALGWSDSEIKTVLDDVYGSVKINWWIWMLLIVVLVAIAAVVFILKIKKPKTKKAAIPQELLSYISDAIASGATKSEIASRLVQAGWPKESVDAAIKSLKIK